MPTNEAPDFAARITIPESDTSSKDHISGEDLDTRLNIEICAKAIHSGVSILVPKLRAVWELDDDIARFFQSCPRTYTSGSALYRQVLIDLLNRWKDVEHAGSCPFPPPTSDKLLAHQEEYGDFQKAQTLKELVSSCMHVEHDGWVPVESWEQIVGNDLELFNEVWKVVKSWTGRN